MSKFEAKLDADSLIYSLGRCESDGRTVHKLCQQQLKPEELKNEVLLLKNMNEERVWYSAAWIHNVEVLEKFWIWVKDLQLKPEELKNEVLLLKGSYEERVWHRTPWNGNVEVFEKLWIWAKELQLKPEELRICVFCKIWPGGRAQKRDHFALSANLTE
jgi:hypothetical protein